MDQLCKVMMFHDFILNLSNFSLSLYISLSAFSTNQLFPSQMYTFF